MILDFDFELESDDWIIVIVSSIFSSDKAGVGGFFDLGYLDFMIVDIFSDSWEFCFFLDVFIFSDFVDGFESVRLGVGFDYRFMNGGLFIFNGSRVEISDFFSEEVFSVGFVKG